MVTVTGTSSGSGEVVATLASPLGSLPQTKWVTTSAANGQWQLSLPPCAGGALGEGNYYTITGLGFNTIVVVLLSMDGTSQDIGALPSTNPLQSGNLPAVVAKDSIALNAADHGLALNGTDDSAALNALIAACAAGSLPPFNVAASASTPYVITAGPGTTLGLAGSVTRKSYVSVVIPATQIKVLAGINAGPVFTNGTAAPLVASHLMAANVDKGGLTGTLLDTHSMQWSTVALGFLLGGTSSCTNATYYCDATAISDGDAKTNSVGNTVTYYDRGSCATNGLLSGLATAAYGGATGPAVVTLNDFQDCHARGVYGVAWDLVQWCDDNFWTGVTSNEVKANGAIVVRCNNSASVSSSAGVYANHFEMLTAENYGSFTGCTGVLLNYQRGMRVDRYFADPGFGSGSAVVDNYSQSHYIERTGFPSSNSAYVYRKNWYEGYDESASAAASTLALLKSRAGGIINANDVLGQFAWDAYLTAGETEVAKWQAIATNVGSGTEKVEVRLWTTSNSSGGYTTRYRFADNGQFGVGTATFTSLLGTAHFVCPGPAVKGLYIAAAASQSANLIHVVDNSANPLFQVDQNGNVTGNGSNGLLKNFRRQMRHATSSSATPSATANTYGSPQTVSPASGFYGLEVAQIRVSYGGTWVSESMTVQLVFTFSDSSTQTDTRTATGTVSSPPSAADIANGEINLYAFKDAVSLVSVAIQVQSTISNSQAFATVTVAAVNT